MTAPTRRLRRSDCYAKIVDDAAPHQIRLTQSGTQVQVSCVCGKPIVRYAPTQPGGVDKMLAAYSEHVDDVVTRNDWGVRPSAQVDEYTDVRCDMCGAQPGYRCRSLTTAEEHPAHAARKQASLRRNGVAP